jgi:two-component system, OmpR family, response regulator
VAERRPAPTLLIVEDDRALGEMLTDLFSNEGYLVDVAHDGQQGLHRGLTGSYDAMIVDRGLPVMDGSELVAVLRSRDIETPALLLTARGSVADRVEGLDAGAQDYLVKPFEIQNCSPGCGHCCADPTAARRCASAGSAWTG